MTLPIREGMSLGSGAGILLSALTGKVTITNTGVTSIQAGPGVTVDKNTGNITVSAKTAGSVKLINTGDGLTGGPITESGQISLSKSGVEPGVYDLASISVDSTGRVTSARSGQAIVGLTGSNPVQVSEGNTPNISINAASESHPGVVTLSNSVTSSSTTTAATSLAVKTAFDALASAIPGRLFRKRGDLLLGLAPDLGTVLPAGNEGQVLTASSDSELGVTWKDLPAQTEGLTQDIKIGDCHLVVKNGIITGVY